MLGFTPNKPLDQPPFPLGEETRFDWDARIGIEFIRSHAKIDDVPSVMDEQLRFYRSAAMESAQHYTGLLLSGTRTMSEQVEVPLNKMITRLPPYEDPYGMNPTYPPHYIHNLKYPVADGYVYLYGGSHISDNVTFRVEPGTRKIRVPIRKDFIDTSNCCNPCSTFAVNGGMLVAYKAGYKSVNEVPATVLLGMMQFITWCVEHPGDELLTQRNRIETRAGLSGLQGSNNIAMICGAIETWRILDDQAW